MHRFRSAGRQETSGFANPGICASAHNRILCGLVLGAAPEFGAQLLAELPDGLTHHPASAISPNCALLEAAPRGAGQHGTAEGEALPEDVLIDDDVSKSRNVGNVSVVRVHIENKHSENETRGM